MKRLWMILIAALVVSGCTVKTTLIQQEVSSTVTTVENLLNPPAPVPENATIRLLFAGDLMFDRSIRQILEKKGPDFILQPLHSYLGGFDAVVANLEGPITSFDSKSIESEVGSAQNYIFTFDPKVGKLLADDNVTIVNLGNNHIGNFGEPGIAQTREILENNHITYFGNTGKVSQHRYVIVPMSGKRIAFVNYNQFVTGGLSATMEDLEQAQKEADFVIVYTHWGTEYVPLASPTIQEKAHDFIDAGADLVIGSHPHVVQQMELYKGKTIYYSLGNFVFDQYLQPETQRGLLVAVTINTHDLSYTTSETAIRLQLNGQTAPQD